jgi:hypothetical protein
MFAAAFWTPAQLLIVLMSTCATAKLCVARFSEQSCCPNVVLESHTYGFSPPECTAGDGKKQRRPLQAAPNGAPVGRPHKAAAAKLAPAPRLPAALTHDDRGDENGELGGWGVDEVVRERVHAAAAANQSSERHQAKDDRGGGSHRLAASLAALPPRIGADAAPRAKGGAAAAGAAAEARKAALAALAARRQLQLPQGGAGSKQGGAGDKARHSQPLRSPLIRATQLRQEETDDLHEDVGSDSDAGPTNAGDAVSDRAAALQEQPQLLKRRRLHKAPQQPGSVGGGEQENQPPSRGQPARPDPGDAAHLAARRPGREGAATLLSRSLEDDELLLDEI